MILVATLLVGGGLAAICRMQSLRHPEFRHTLVRDIVRSSKIMVNFFQVTCAITVVYPIGLPEIAADFLKQFNVFNFDIGRVFRIGCFQTIDFVMSISIMVATVALLLLLDVAWYCWRRQTKSKRAPPPTLSCRFQAAALAHRKHDLRFLALVRRGQEAMKVEMRVKADALSLAFYVLVFAHMPISVKVFSVFQCREVDGKFYLIGDMRKQCLDGEWNSVYLPICIVLIVIVVIGFPLGILILLVCKRRSLDDETSIQTFGFLYAPYKRNLYWYEVVIIFRKLLLSGILSMLYTMPTIQISLAAIFSLGFHLVHAWLQPFRAAEANNIEYACLLATELTFIGALTASASNHRVASEHIGGWIVALTVATLSYAVIITFRLLCRNIMLMRAFSAKPNAGSSKTRLVPQQDGNANVQHAIQIATSDASITAKPPKPR